MAIARLDPIRELEEVERRLYTLFGRVPARSADGREENITVFEWAPPVDIIESDNEYLIKVELPEIKPRPHLRFTCGAARAHPDHPDDNPLIIGA